MQLRGQEMPSTEPHSHSLAKVFHYPLLNLPLHSLGRGTLGLATAVLAES